MAQVATVFATTVAFRIAEKTRRLKHRLFDTYHPELHYMRGPGPKWREKHGQLPAGKDLMELGLNGFGKAGA